MTRLQALYARLSDPSVTEAEREAVSRRIKRLQEAGGALPTAQAGHPDYLPPVPRVRTEATPEPPDWLSGVKIKNRDNFTSSDAAKVEEDK